MRDSDGRRSGGEQERRHAAFSLWRSSAARPSAARAGQRYDGLVAETREREAASGWNLALAGLSVAGRGVARAAARASAAVASAYRAVDPDLRRHVAELPLVALTALAPRRDAIEPLPVDGWPPVVFVHGLGGHPGNFAPLQTYFRLCGRRRTYAFAQNGGELAEEGARLAAFLEAIVAANGLSDDAALDVVAHSMGGLVARLALEDARAVRRIGTLVTLGTPHAGTHVARYAATPRTLDLRPSSAVVARLARQLPWRGPPKQPRLVAMWSDADMMLLPATAARVEGAENVEMPGISHNGYLLHPTAWRRIYEVLTPLRA